MKIPFKIRTLEQFDAAPPGGYYSEDGQYLVKREDGEWLDNSRRTLDESLGDFHALDQIVVMSTDGWRDKVKMRFIGSGIQPIFGSVSSFR